MYVLETCTCTVIVGKWRDEVKHLCSIAQDTLPAPATAKENYEHLQNCGSDYMSQWEFMPTL